MFICLLPLLPSAKIVNIQVREKYSLYFLIGLTDANGLITIQEFTKKFNLVGGIHLPKIIRCVGSNGGVYKQLVKVCIIQSLITCRLASVYDQQGDDDLRQDAVMQQMFALVGTLLKEERETRKRCLGIRTYKVFSSPLNLLTKV